MPHASASLRTFFESVYHPLKLPLPRSIIAESYRCTIDRLAEALAREPTLDDLNADSVRKLKGVLNATGRGRRHLSTHLDRLAELWSYAHTIGLAIACDRALFEQTKPSEMTFADALESGVIANILPGYFARKTTIRDEHTHKQYRYALANLATALGHVPTVTDLTDDSLCEMVSHLQARGLAAATINDRVGRICTLWRWLANRGHLQTRPTNNAVPEPKRIPLAWSSDEIATLFQACDNWKGDIAGVQGAGWWKSLHYVAWDSGERISALMACRWDWITDEWLAIPAEVRKGKKTDRVYKLHADTLAILSSIREPKRELIWPWTLDPTSLWYHYKKLRESAGLALDRRSAFHRIRRSVATDTEAAGGNATELLDHSSRDLTKASYLDPRYLKAAHAVDFLFRPSVSE